MGKKHHLRQENTNIYALIVYCSFHLILCNSSPGHLSHYSSRNIYYEFPKRFAAAATDRLVALSLEFKKFCMFSSDI